MPSPPDTERTAHNRRVIFLLVSLLVVLLAVMVLRLFVGESFAWPDERVLPLRRLRLVVAVIVGVALASGGVALQALLRNPLAEPFILGLSTGAGVGIMANKYIVMRLIDAGYDARAFYGSTHLGALSGALLCMTIVYLAGRKRGMIDPLGLLLTGVVLSTINGAIIVLINYFSGPAGVNPDLARWMMGFLDESAANQTIQVVGTITVIGLGLLVWQGPAMDVATFSDAEARAMGVDLGRLRVMLFAVASVLAAGAVVLAGPLAFVGLICPHVARVLLGPSHRVLVLGAAMIGALLILTADMIVVAADVGQGRMPIGVFTAVAGGIVFLVMLRSEMGRG